MASNRTSRGRMRGLDDGPDGLNDLAFERALRSSARRRVTPARVIRTHEFAPEPTPTTPIPYRSLADGGRGVGRRAPRRPGGRPMTAALIKLLAALVDELGVDHLMQYRELKILHVHLETDAAFDRWQKAL